MPSPTLNTAVETPLELTVGIVSADRLLRDGVEAILTGKGFSVPLSVDCAGDLMRGLNRADAAPDVLILVDAPPSDDDEISALSAVREAHTGLPTIVIAEKSADRASLERLISAGVDAILPTDLCAEILVQSIRLVLLGEQFIFSEYVQRLLDHPHPNHTPMPDITLRELEMIRFVAAGNSNKTIADELNLTEPSVKVHIRRLLRKIGAANRTQAAIWALERGLVLTESAEPAKDRREPLPKRRAAFSR